MEQKRRAYLYQGTLFFSALLFVASVLLILMLGASVYRGMKERETEAYLRGTGLSYITAKVRHGDGEGRIEAGSIGGCSALFIKEEYDGIAYRTAVYVYEGYLCELFSAEKDELGPEDGTPLLASEELCFSVRDGMLRATNKDGTETVLLLSLRSGKGES